MRSRAGHLGTHGWRGTAAVGLALAAGLLPAGCAAVGFIGALEQERRRHSTRDVLAEYTGFQGRTFAVIVAADRIIQSNFPAVVPWITQRVTQNLAENLRGVAAGYVPAEDVLAFQANTPQWVAMPLGRVAEELGVDRLIVIELLEYRLHDPGNRYLWDGVAMGTVSVVEADSTAPDARAFERSVRVTFPDRSGIGPEQLSLAAVNSELSRRFLTRASWLFYDHKEPYYPDF